MRRNIGVISNDIKRAKNYMDKFSDNGIPSGRGSYYYTIKSDKEIYASYSLSENMRGCKFNLVYVDRNLTIKQMLFIRTMASGEDAGICYF